MCSTVVCCILAMIMLACIISSSNNVENCGYWRLRLGYSAKIEMI